MAMKRYTFRVKQNKLSYSCDMCKEALFKITYFKEIATNTIYNFTCCQRKTPFTVLIYYTLQKYNHQ